MNTRNALPCILVVVALTTSCIPLSAFRPVSPDPVIAVDQERHDFGNIPGSDLVQTVFIVKNDGGRTLEISRVQTSCGCTAAMMDSQTLRPGISSRLKVTFDPRGRSGPQTRQVWLYSNDPKTPQKQLLIMATIMAATPTNQPRVQVLPTTAVPTVTGTPMGPSQSVPVTQPQGTMQTSPNAPATPAQPTPTPAGH